MRPAGYPWPVRQRKRSRILVTGASSGIGRAAAEMFARRGADLALVARSRTGLEQTARAVRRLGATAYVLPADVADAQAIERVVERAQEQLGGLDVVVANAGAGSYGRFTQTSREDFERAVEVTLFGTVNTVRAALPALESTAGTIVITGSVGSRIPLPLQSSYVAAKHGVRGFVNTLRPELRAQGSRVRVAVVDPGPVDTPFWDHVQPSEGVLPPKLAGAYSAHTVARALVQAAVQPRGDRIVGAAMLPAELAYRLARPLADVALAAFTRWALDHGRPPSAPAAIWEPSGHGAAAAGLHGRPSALRSAEEAAQRLMRLPLPRAG
jgi:short-subunit dehydrogenase